MKKTKKLILGIVLGSILVLLWAGAASSEFFMYTGGSENWNVEYVNSVNLTYYATEVFAQGDYAYVTSMIDYPLQGALDVINVRYPENAFVEGTCDSSDLKMPVDLFIYDGYAYVADVWAAYGEPSRFYQIDVTNPSNPHIIQARAVDGNARAVFCQGDFAYVACMDAGLGIFSHLGLLPLGIVDAHNSAIENNSAIEIFVRGDFAYVADYNFGEGNPGCLTIVNISDYNSPYIMGECRTAGEDPLMVYVQEHIERSTDDIYTEPDEIRLYAYVADKEGITIMDVTDAEDPFRVAHVQLPGDSMCVHVDGEYAYVASGYYGVVVIDISVPTYPTPIGYCSIPGFATGVFAQNDYIYVPAGDTLHILQFVD
jgi:hypothetical protein